MTSVESFDHKKACGYIEESAKLGSRPGLERIRDLCARLGNPQDELRFIHIAGTNGKGSTAAMISSVLTEAGLCTGMYYSPALCGLTDHFRLNGELISDKDYDLCVSKVASANEELIRETGESATQFELETAVAFIYFRENHCDAVVLECGMGGRDDATNIVGNKICCVFASVSYDHMQYLGNTLSEITDVKSGIITSDCPVIAFGSSEDVINVIEKKCKDTGSDLHIVRRCDVTGCGSFPHGQTVSYKNFADVSVPLNGTFQAGNAALALETVDVIRRGRLIEGFDPDDETIRSGIEKTHWPYRFQCINADPPVIVDGAHNADAAAKLADSIREYLEGYAVILVMGMFSDKEYDKVASIIAPLAVKVYTIATPDNPRALSAADLAKCVSKYCNQVHACKSVKEACALSLDEACGNSGKSAIVACGSLSYLKLFADVLAQAD